VQGHGRLSAVAAFSYALHWQNWRRSSSIMTGENSANVAINSLMLRRNFHQPSFVHCQDHTIASSATVPSRPQCSQGCQNPKNTKPNPNPNPNRIPNHVNILWKINKKYGTDRIQTPVTEVANRNTAGWAMQALGRCGLLHVFNPAIDGTIYELYFTNMVAIKLKGSTVLVPSWRHKHNINIT